MEKITLANIDYNDARFSSKLRALGKTIFFTFVFSIAAYVLLLPVYRVSLPIIFLLFVTGFAFYFFRNMKKMLYSIVFDPDAQVYEISFVKSGKIVGFRMKKDEVKLNVRQDVFANSWSALEIQIVYRKKDYFIQRESGPWTNGKMQALRKALKDLSQLKPSV